VDSKEQVVAKLEAKIRQCEALRDDLGDETTDRMVDEFRQRLQTLGVAIDQAGQRVQGPQTNITGGEQHGPVLSGEFSGPVDFSKHYHGAGTPIDADEAEAIYRRNIARRLRRLRTDLGQGEISADELSRRIQGWVAHAAHADTWGLRRALLSKHNCGR
jgi:hypothetical protein